MRHTKDFFFNPSYRRPGVLKTLLKKVASQNRVDLSYYRPQHGNHQAQGKRGPQKGDLKDPVKKVIAM